VCGVFGVCGIPEIKKFQAVLSEYQLNVVFKEHLNALIYSGSEAEKHLYFCLNANHLALSPVCLPTSSVSNIATSARKATIRLPIILVINCLIF
jgi:hypothetical protein